MARPVEPMDVDCMDSEFDKENTFRHGNVPCTEKGYEELDVSELNMKLRYSMTPASSPMSKSYTACPDRYLEKEDTLNCNNTNANLTRSLNSTMRNDSVVKALKSLPLQSLHMEQFVDGNTNASVLRQLDSTLTDNGNVTITVTNDIDDNISLPSCSSSALHTPEATTPTKDMKDEGSPIMRGLKSVFNMFRSSQSPVPPADGDNTVKQEQQNHGDTYIEENKHAVASTPISVHRNRDNNTTKRSSPHKDTIVFKEDLEKELNWKNDTTFNSSIERIPVHKMLLQNPSKAETTVGSDLTHCNTESHFNDTVEYMDVSNNETVIEDKTITEFHEVKDVSVTVESDGEFVDCETTFSKNESYVLDVKTVQQMLAVNETRNESYILDVKAVQEILSPSLVNANYNKETQEKALTDTTNVSFTDQDFNNDGDQTMPTDYSDYSKCTSEILSELDKIEANISSEPNTLKTEHTKASERGEHSNENKISIPVPTEEKDPKLNSEKELNNDNHEASMSSKLITMKTELYSEIEPKNDNLEANTSESAEHTDKHEISTPVTTEENYSKLYSELESNNKNREANIASELITMKTEPNKTTENAENLEKHEISALVTTEENKRQMESAIENLESNITEDNLVHIMSSKQASDNVEINETESIVSSMPNEQQLDVASHDLTEVCKMDDGKCINSSIVLNPVKTDNDLINSRGSTDVSNISVKVVDSVSSQIHSESVNDLKANNIDVHVMSENVNTGLSVNVNGTNNDPTLNLSPYSHNISTSVENVGSPNILINTPNVENQITENPCDVPLPDDDDIEKKIESGNISLELSTNLSHSTSKSNMAHTSSELQMIEPAPGSININNDTVSSSDQLNIVLNSKNNQTADGEVKSYGTSSNSIENADVSDTVIVIDANQIDTKTLPLCTDAMASNSNIIIEEKSLNIISDVTVTSTCTTSKSNMDVSLSSKFQDNEADSIPAKDSNDSVHSSDHLYAPSETTNNNTEPTEVNYVEQLQKSIVNVNILDTSMVKNDSQESLAPLITDKLPSGIDVTVCNEINNLNDIINMVSAEIKSDGICNMSIDTVSLSAHCVVEPNTDGDDIKQAHVSQIESVKNNSLVLPVPNGNHSIPENMAKNSEITDKPSPEVIDNIQGEPMDISMNENIHQTENQVCVTSTHHLSEHLNQANDMQHVEESHENRTETLQNNASEIPGINDELPPKIFTNPPNTESLKEKSITVHEEVIVSANNSPYVSLMSGINTDVEKTEEEFEEIENPFTSNRNVSSSPPIEYKGYSFNFDEMDDPFATKTKIRQSPPPGVSLESSDNQNIDCPSFKAPINNTKTIANRRKSQPAERKKPLTIKKKLNSSYDIKNSPTISLDKTGEEYIIKENKANLVADTTARDNTAIEVTDKKDTIVQDIRVDKVNTSSTESSVSCKLAISSEKATSSSEQSTYYSAGTSSTDSFLSKNVFNLPEIDDINFNPFVTKSKIRQSPSLDTNMDHPSTLADVDIDPFETKTKMRNSPDFTCDGTNNVQLNRTTTLDEAEIIEQKQEVKGEKKLDTEEIENNTSANTTGTVSLKANTDENITTHEINTEDEDTIEGPFIDVDDDIDKISDLEPDNDDMMQFNELKEPPPGNEDNLDGEVFIDAEAFEFLLNQNKSNVVADSGKESLFLKFDPLFAKRISSDGLFASLNTHKKQSTPTKPSRPSLRNEASPIAGPSTLNVTYDGENNTTHESIEDVNVTVTKPTMVVTPALNPVVTPRNKSITPTRSNRRSITFTSPAIAVIDRLLSMSSNNSLLGQDTTIVHSNNEQSEADLALTQLRELLAEKEISVYNLRCETNELKDRLATMESQVKNLELEGEVRLKKINELHERIAEKTKINKNMAAVVEEYERTIASLIADIEQDKKRHAVERMQLINERDEQTAHLTSMEVSFNDLHSKYEKSKQVILTAKANEEIYKKSIRDFEEQVQKMQANYETLKQHATAKLNHANQELEKMNRAHEAEVVKLNAMIKRNQLLATSLQETLAQKIKANDELTAICDELINKVG